MNAFGYNLQTIHRLGSTVDDENGHKLWPIQKKLVHNNCDRGFRYVYNTVFIYSLVIEKWVVKIILTVIEDKYNEKIKFALNHWVIFVQLKVLLELVIDTGPLIQKRILLHPWWLFLDQLFGNPAKIKLSSWLLNFVYVQLDHIERASCYKNN